MITSDPRHSDGEKRLRWVAVILAMAAVLAMAAIAMASSGEDGPTIEEVALRVGTSVEGEVTAESPVIHTPTLDDRSSDAPVRGTRFTLDIETAGPVTIELRSYLFDAYLVLEDASGEVIAEDDDGLIGTQSQITSILEPGRHAILACALRGGSGPFALDVRAGLPPAVDRAARTELAIEDARRSVDVREMALGEDHPRTATSLGSLGGLLISAGRYREAEVLLERALSIREFRLGKTHRLTATSLHDLALINKAQGRYIKAENLYNKALAIRQVAPDVGPDHPHTARTLNNLGVLYSEMGRYGEADRFLRRAMVILEASRGPDHPETAESLRNLGTVLRLQGRFANAEPLLMRAHKAIATAYGTDHYKVAMVLNELASLYQAQRRWGEAEEACRRALEIRAFELGPDHPDLALSLNNLGTILVAQGRLDEADRYYVHARAAFETMYGPDHPKTAISLSNIAVLHSELGRRDEAESLLLHANSILDSAHGAGHMESVESRHVLVVFYESGGRYKEALGHALGMLDGGQLWLSRELCESRGDTRFSCAGALWHAADHAVWDWCNGDGQKASLDTVYRRICALDGLVYRHVARLARSLSSAASGDADLRDLHNDLLDLDGQLSALAYPERIEEPDTYKAQLETLRDRRQDVLSEILTRLGLDPESESTDGVELSRLLPESSAALDFMIHRPLRPPIIKHGEVVLASHWDDLRVICFVTVARAGEPVLVDLGDATVLEHATDAWLDEISHDQRGRPPEVSLDGPSPADRVRTLLLDPILAALPRDTTRLFIIPDDFIGEVPFGAISVGPDQFLLELLDVVYATDPVTLRDLLMAAPETTEEAPTILALGGVDYDARSAIAEDLVRPDLSQAEHRRGSSTFSRKWGPLSSTSVEVDGLSKQATSMWPTAEAPQILKATDATEEAVKALAPGHTILHFATHGFFQREGFVSLWKSALDRAHEDFEPRGLGAMLEMSGRPKSLDPFAGMPALEGEEPGLLAGLILAGGNLDPALDPDRDDGVLTATEVSSLDLSACRLAVLSACQSSLGNRQSGEGLQSLRRGFHEAGTDTVIASLWKVDDAVTQRLMHTFYEELWTHKRGVGDALRRARLRVLQDTRDPYYWGGFTLSGEWR